MRALHHRRWPKLLLLAVLAAPARVGGQTVQGSLEDPFAPAGLGSAPYAEMSALLEVTIFNIDVLTLEVRVPPEIGHRLGELVQGREYSEELADSVGAIILVTDDLWARQVFQRDVGIGRLLGGMRESSEKAAEAGYISHEYYEEFSANLPVWFAFLEEDGAKEGDEIVFRIQGDRVRTLYRTVDHRVLLDQYGIDSEARRGSIPSFFAPGSRFRKRLMESLLELNMASASGEPL